ncbi:hypothetical protein Tco_0586881 [Tanacetum coccineum]
MFLNMDQLEKQLDKEEFQEIGSMAAFKILEFRDTVMQHKESVKKLIDERALHKREYDTRVNERQMQTTKGKDTSSRSGNDALADDAYIIPICDEEPMAKVQTTAEINVFAIVQQHTEQPEFNNEGVVDKNAEQCHDTCPLPAKLTDNQITELSNQSLKSKNICLKKTVSQFQKDFSKLEAHCLNLELQLQNNVLKSGRQSQFLKVKSNEAKVKHDIDVSETINIELEYKVAKLLKENETLKRHYKELFDSIKTTRAKTIEHTTSLIAQNAELKAQLDVGQRKAFGLQSRCKQVNCKRKINLGAQVSRFPCPRFAPWDSSGLYNVVTSSSRYLTYLSLHELFGVESPSEESPCSLPLQTLCCYFLWHPRFEPFVSSVVVIAAAIVDAIVVIVAAVVVESLGGLAKGRPALIPPDVGQRKIVSFTANANEQEKGFAIAALKNELRKLTGNSVNTKFAKLSILGKPILQSLRNQSVVRQPTAFKSERPRISKPRESRNSSKNMPRFSSNDMVHNHYLEEAKKKTEERGRNSRPSVMPSAKSQSTANGSKPKPGSNTQTSRNWPASNNSFVTTKTMTIAEHSKNSRNFTNSKHFVCSTCQKCVFNANHDSCVTKFLNEVNSRAKVPTGKIFTSSTTKVDSEPINGSNEDITNQYECEQTIDVSAGTINLSAGTSVNPKKEGLRVWLLKRLISQKPGLQGILI